MTVKYNICVLDGYMDMRPSYRKVASKSRREEAEKVLADLKAEYPKRKFVLRIVKRK